MPQRWCLDCGRLYDRDTTGTWRCPGCQAQADGRANARRAGAAAKRPSSTARGYGSVYRRNRNLVVARALEAARAGQPQRCWLCKKPCLASEPLTAEHKVAVRNGGSSDLANLVPAHRNCNSTWNKAR